MLTGLAFFWSGLKSGIFGDKGLPPSEEGLNKPVLGLKKKVLVPVLSFLAAPFIALMLASYEPVLGGESFFGDQNFVNILFKGIGIAILLYMAFIIYQATPSERKKLAVALFITLFMTVFWGFHELSGSVITLFADRNVNLSIIDAAQTNSLNSMFIIFLSIPISLLWTSLAKKKKNPRTPYKFGMGLLLAGVSFYVLALSRGAADENGMVPFVYLLLMYFLLSVGELFMSPVGLSKITDLSPKRIVAFMMGVWFLSSAFAFQVVGFIGKKLAIESDNADIRGFDSLDVYIGGFEMIAQYAIGAGLIVFILSPLLNRWMQNVH